MRELRNGTTHLIGWIVAGPNNLHYPIPYRELDALEEVERDLDAARTPAQAKSRAQRDIEDEGRYPDPCGYPTETDAALAFLVWLHSDNHSLEEYVWDDLTPGGYADR